MRLSSPRIGPTPSASPGTADDRLAGADVANEMAMAIIVRWLQANPESAAVAVSTQSAQTESPGRLSRWWPTEGSGP
jgi:hypothetical protein